MSKFVTIICEGESRVHAKGVGSGNYATICGMDGSDPGVQQETVPTVRGARIDCPECAQIIRTARQYTERNIASF